MPWRILLLSLAWAAALAAPQPPSPAAAAAGVDPLDSLQSRALALLERAARSERIPLAEWATVERVPGASPRESRALSREELDEARAQGKTTDLLWDRAANFLGSHTLNLRLPPLSSEQLKKGVEEGRGKMKKMMSMMFMAGAMKMAAIVPLLLGGLFLLAGKAFLVSKLALVLSLLILLKKLLAAKQEGHEVHHAVYSGGGGHHGGGGGWDKRSLSSPAHDIAYAAQKP